MGSTVVVDAATAPQVTIAMVLYRGGVDAVAALAAVAANTPEPYEVVIVDNASPDASGALVRLSVTGARFVFNDVNLGFGGAMNQAVALARAPAVCLLNPDTEVQPGWLDPLLRRLAGDGGCAAVTSLLLDPSGAIQEAGGVIDGSGHTHAVGGPSWELAADVLGSRQIDYASAACLVVRRAAFLEIGGFSPEFFPAYFEDADLALRLSAAGWSIWLEPESRVVHRKGATDTGGSAQHLAHTNLLRFRSKWRTELARRPMDGTDPASRTTLLALPGGTWGADHS